MFLVFVFITLLLSGAQSPPTLRELNQELAATDWPTRARAVRQAQDLVRSDPDVARHPEFRQAIVSVLERENEGILARYDSGQGSSESFSDYYSTELTPLCITLLEANPRDPRLLRALVAATYNPDSALVSLLADQGAPLAPLVVGLARSERLTSRWNAYGLMGELLKRQKQKNLRVAMDAGTEALVGEALRAGLFDPSASGRRQAIRAIVNAGHTAAIPILATLATSDPDAAQTPGDYNVRRLARDAVEKLRGRKN